MKVSDYCPFLRCSSISPSALRTLAELSDPPFDAVRIARGCGVEVTTPDKPHKGLWAWITTERNGAPIIRVADGLEPKKENWIIACALASLTLQGPILVKFRKGDAPNKMFALYATELLMPKGWVQDAMAAGIIKLEDLAMMFGVNKDIITFRLATM